jgi:hypothetical protein
MEAMAHRQRCFAMVYPNFKMASFLFATWNDQRATKSKVCEITNMLPISEVTCNEVTIVYSMTFVSFNCWESGDGADMQKQTIPPKKNMKQNKQTNKKALTFYISWYIRIIYLSQLHHELWMTRGWPTPAFFGGATGALSGTCETSSHQWRKNNTSEYRRILHEHTMNCITTSCRISSKLSWMSETQHKDTQSI